MAFPMARTKMKRPASAISSPQGDPGESGDSVTADASASGHGGSALSALVDSADLSVSSARSSLALSACKEEVAEESDSTEKDRVFVVASWFVDILFCKFASIPFVDVALET